MPNFRYISDEPRVFPFIATDLDDDGVPTEHTGLEPLNGDVIEAALNPGETWWEETSDPVALVPRPDEQAQLEAEAAEAASEKAQTAAAARAAKKAEAAAAKAAAQGGDQTPVA